MNFLGFAYRGTCRNDCDGKAPRLCLSFLRYSSHPHVPSSQLSSGNHPFYVPADASLWACVSSLVGWMSVEVLVFGKVQSCAQLTAFGAKKTQVPRARSRYSRKVRAGPLSGKGHRLHDLCAFRNVDLHWVWQAWAHMLHMRHVVAALLAYTTLVKVQELLG